MSAKVRWDEVDPATFEDLCAVLISRLHSDVRRIDGAGGDGGRDVQIATAKGPIIYQMKSFTGRVTPTRRRQIAHSLSKASNHRPAEWRLVVPIDPTPSEDEWFSRIARGYPFACQWLGRTWLDANVAAHPDVVRYYLEGGSDEVVSILRELAREQGALHRGVPDAIDRMKALSSRLNLLDPHYSFGLSSDKRGTVAVSAWPKYPGAEYDRPIKIHTAFTFPDTSEGRSAAKDFRDSLDFGTGVTVKSEHIDRIEFDIPAGLDEVVSGGQFTLIPSDNVDDLPGLSTQIRIIDEDGRTVAQLPLFLKSRTSGRRGGELGLRDATGTVQAKLRYDLDDRSVQIRFTFEEPNDVLPATILPALQFLAEYRPPHSVVVLHNDVEAGAPIAIERALDPTLLDFLSLIRALDDIQRASGVYFTIPKRFTNEELGSISTARRLLAGETVQSTWSTVKLTSTVGALPSLKAALERGPGPLVAENELTLILAGQAIPLGFTRQTLPSVVVAQWPIVEPNTDPETPIEVVLQPGSDDRATMSLVKDISDRTEGRSTA